LKGITSVSVVYVLRHVCDITTDVFVAVKLSCVRTSWCGCSSLLEPSLGASETDPNLSLGYLAPGRGTEPAGLD
jgi:hypothetical protein